NDRSRKLYREIGTLKNIDKRELKERGIELLNSVAYYQTRDCLSEFGEGKYASAITHGISNKRDGVVASQKYLSIKCIETCKARIKLRKRRRFFKRPEQRLEYFLILSCFFANRYRGWSLPCHGANVRGAINIERIENWIRNTGKFRNVIAECFIK